MDTPSERRASRQMRGCDQSVSEGKVKVVTETGGAAALACARLHANVSAALRSLEGTRCSTKHVPATVSRGILHAPKKTMVRPDMVPVSLQ